jgi:uncharacterized protein (DUF2249 family)
VTAAQPTHESAPQPVEIEPRPGAHATPGAEGGSGCACGHEAEALPELDATVIPHALRHATIFGALGSLAPGAGLVLVAPHDPLPLLAQLEDRWPGRFDVVRTETGPTVWRLRFTRVQD